VEVRMNRQSNVFSLASISKKRYNKASGKNSMPNDNQNQPHEEKRNRGLCLVIILILIVIIVIGITLFFILKRGSSSGTNTTNSSSNSSSKNLISCSNVKGMVLLTACYIARPELPI
jgi:heme/copper-type cytochrome/quinol oxidase subunit 2